MILNLSLKKWWRFKISKPIATVWTVLIIFLEWIAASRTMFLLPKAGRDKERYKYKGEKSEKKHRP